MFVSVLILRGLVRELEQAGVTRQQLAERSGICAERLWGEQPRLSPAEWPALLTAALELSQGELLESAPFSEDMKVFSLVMEAASAGHRRAPNDEPTIPLLRALLRSENDLHGATLASCATKLGLRCRALRRRLQKEGSNFSELLEQERCRIACNVLSRPETTVRDAALRSGYSEVSPFYRAFQRWMGQTPAAYRRIALRARPGAVAEQPHALVSQFASPTAASPSLVART